MNLEKSIRTIESKIGLGNNWVQLWERYLDLYRYDGTPLNERVSGPRASRTIQDQMFYIRDWILDIQSGGKEMQLAMNRLDSPEEHRIRFDGISLEVANFDKEVSDMMTPYYALALQKLSEVSYHGYRSANIDPVNQSTLRKEFGPMSYKKLEHAVARCEQNKQSLLENHGYGPAVFRFFREAGEQGDQLVEKENYDDEMVTAFHKYMISKLQQKYGK